MLEQEEEAEGEKKGEKKVAIKTVTEVQDFFP